jgi:hypothetical protein
MNQQEFAGFTREPDSHGSTNKSHRVYIMIKYDRSKYWPETGLQGDFKRHVLDSTYEKVLKD